MSSPPVPARAVLFGALGVYAAGLVAIEAFWSADLARQLCSDVNGPIRLYALNTTLSAGLLFGAALLLAFAASAGGARPRRERSFLWLQAAVFFALAADDRFLLHESVGVKLGIDDAFVLAAAGVLELVLLAGLADLRSRPARVRRSIVFAGASFAVMVVIDACADRLAALPRLTLEDSAKTCGAAWLFAFAWDVARAALARDPDPGRAPVP